jgi:transcriptional regulator with XRE-family HTH domain
MNLTQKQLAALAKVSTPTISRFENDKKDIQLSSVLAILGVLGMTDKRTLVFPEENFARDERDAIVFWGQDGETKVLCRIARAALEDHFSDGDRLKPEAAFKKHRKQIESWARRKYLSDQCEPDGSILIQTLDIS